MKNELFAFEGHDFKVFLDDKENPWFLCKEICNLLEIKNNRDVNLRLDDDQKVVGTIDTLGGQQKAVYINESGLYAVIFMSRTDKSKRFQKRVTSEILPQIRKTGSYNSIDPLESLTSTKGIQKLLLIAQEKLILEEKLQIAQPKIDYHDRVKASDDLTPLSTFGQTSKIGFNNIFKFCHQIKWVYWSNNRTVPYKNIVKAGLLSHNESEWKDYDGVIHQTHKIFITGLGKVELMGVYNREHPAKAKTKQMELI